MSTVAILSQKGGVGKTTVTLGLASSALAAGHRVLVVDLDPQASSTWAVGVDPASTASAMTDVLEGERSAASVICESTWGSGLDVLPAATDLAAWDPEGNPKKRAGKLRRALKAVAPAYDVILLDCPPGIGQLTVTALGSADLAVLVVEPAALSLNTLATMADLVDDVWHKYNDQLDLAGVIVNRMPAIGREADHQYDELGKIVGKRAVWKPSIPNRAIVNQALGERRPIHAYGSRSAAASDAFDRLYAKLRKAAAR